MAQAWIHWGSYGGSSNSEQQIGSAVPPGHTYHVKMWITNRTAGAISARVRIGTSTAAPDDYHAYDVPIPANDFLVLPQFIAIAADELYIKQSGDGLAFRADVLDIT